MHIAIAIVGFRNPEDIVRCLGALEQSNHTDFEVVICENGGDAAAAELQNRLPARLARGQAVRILPSMGNLGYAAGTNRCFDASPDADGWWVLNPDTEPSATSLQNMVLRLQQGDCDAVGCSVIHADGKVSTHGGVWQAAIGRAISIGNRSSQVNAKRSDIEGVQNYLSGSSILVSRAFVERAGRMREDYFLYCEEIEWCLRAARKGLRLGFAENANIIHHQGTTMGNFHDIRRRGKISVYLMERNRLHLTRDLFASRLPTVLLMTVPLLLNKYARHGAWRQFIYGLEGALAAFRGERGPPDWLPG
jgi:GT2 family glycosyltransferase